jgi:dTDP-4-dehydrorhamnose 3,5-epimerase
MRFTPTDIPGVVVIDIEPIADDRGFFARSFCRDTFSAHGLDPDLLQCNISFNRRRGTLRGMHYQAAPHAEAKLIRVTAGAIVDVALDLRPESPTFRRHVSIELSAASRRMLYIPHGCAHGFQSLADDTEIFYQMSAAYEPAASRGVRWNDPAFAIRWPIADPILSPRDAAYPDFQP